MFAFIKVNCFVALTVRIVCGNISSGNKLDKVLKSKPSKICGRQPFFKGCLPQILLGPLFNTLSQMKYLIVTTSNIIHNEAREVVKLHTWSSKLLSND